MAADVDLAVVRLSGAAKTYLENKLREKTGLTSVPLLPMMDSDKAVMPSQYDPLAADANVMAIGHPLGSEFQTQTVGQVEGLKRVNMARPISTWPTQRLFSRATRVGRFCTKIAWSESIR